jgi:hypothetical protein
VDDLKGALSAAAAQLVETQESHSLEKTTIIASHRAQLDEKNEHWKTLLREQRAEADVVEEDLSTELRRLRDSLSL